MTFFHRLFSCCYKSNNQVHPQSLQMSSCEFRLKLNSLAPKIISIIPLEEEFKRVFAKFGPQGNYKLYGPFRELKDVKKMFNRLLNVSGVGATEKYLINELELDIIDVKLLFANAIKTLQNIKETTLIATSYVNDYVAKEKVVFFKKPITYSQFCLTKGLGSPKESSKDLFGISEDKDYWGMHKNQNNCASSSSQ